MVAAWAGSERHFDAHTHFFNAQDVPVAGFMSKSVAHGIASPRLRELVVALAPIAEWLGKSALTPKAEFDQLCRRPDRGAKSLVLQSEDLDSEIERQRDETALQLYLEIRRRGNEIPRLFEAANSSARSVNPGFLVDRATTFSVDLVREALRDGGGQRGASTRIMSNQESEALSLRGMLQFVGFMLAPRHHNVRTFIRRFGEGSPRLPLSGCFAALVDFNYWLDCPAKASNLQDQVLLHERLSLLSRGFVMPLVPYNPWVDIEESDASLKLVEMAVNRHGHVGVKIYPPMGYYPYGNQAIKVDSPMSRPDPALLDRKLTALYELCDSLGVPVMAHASDSAGRDAAHDELAGPRGWAELRDRGPLLRRLTVNAGHFGGEREHPSGNWTEGFIEIMKNEGHLRVYGDLGYWTELAEGRAEFEDKLARVLSTRLNADETAADRVMYGSDWLMLSQEPGWPTYAERIAEIVHRLAAAPALASKVLGGNAMRCYGLTRDSGLGRLENLVSHHVEHGDGPPGWLQGQAGLV